MAVVVRVPGKNRQRAVHLLSQDCTSQLMRKRHASQRKQQTRSLPCCLRPSIRRANAQHDCLGSRIPQTSQKGGEFFAGELLSAAVEQDQAW